MFRSVFDLRCELVCPDVFCVFVCCLCGLDGACWRVIMSMTVSVCLSEIVNLSTCVKTGAWCGSVGLRGLECAHV